MEEILIPLIVFMFVGFIIKSIIDYKKWKLSQLHGINEPDREGSLTQSELKALVQSAVEEAVEPLQAEVAALRNEHRAALPEPSEALLDDWETDLPDDVPPQRSRQRSV